MYIIKTFPSKALSTKMVSGLILSSMEKVEKDMLKDFEKTTETWKEHKGETAFEHGLRFSGGNAVIEIRTDGEIWHYLDKGTSVRFVPMEPGFRRKTQPGVIGSVTGRGGALRYKDGRVVINKKQPHKGIDARHWSEDIGNKYDDVLQKALDDAIRKGMA